MKKQATGSGKAFFSKLGTSCNIQAKRAALAALPKLTSPEEENSTRREQLMNRLASLPTEQPETLLTGSAEP